MPNQTIAQANAATEWKVIPLVVRLCQRAPKGNAWVEARIIGLADNGKSGRVVQETLLTEAEGGPLHTIAIRWSGDRGVAVYAVMRREAWSEVEELHLTELHRGL